MEDLIKKQVEIEQKYRGMFINKTTRDMTKRVQDGVEADTAYGDFLLSSLTMKVAAEIGDRLNKAAAGHASRGAAAFCILNGQDINAIAYIGLKTCLNRMSSKRVSSGLYADIGQKIEDEITLRDLRNQDEELYKRLFALASKRTRYPFKKALFTKVTNDEQHVSIERWSHQDRIITGAFVLDAVITATGLFEETKVKTAARKKIKTRIVLQLTDQGVQFVERYKSNILSNATFYPPMVVAPKKWVTPNSGGYLTRNVKPITITKQRSGGYQEDLQNWDMPIVYTALNALQETPFKINKIVLDVIQRVFYLDAVWSGLPALRAKEIPPAPVQCASEADGVYQERLKKWKRSASKAKKADMEMAGIRLWFLRNLETAKEFKDFNQIFIPMQMDFRGRVYCVPDFNFQGPDWMRALFLFRDGKPLGKDGWRWLGIHLANLAKDIAEEDGSGKITKMSLEHRLQWTLDNTDRILSWANDPINNNDWSLAGKKARYQLLAAAIEWKGYIEQGEDYVCSLPITFDGTCSGLQHYACLFADDATGELVNLVPDMLPQDIYQAVADRVSKKVRADLDHTDKEIKAAAQRWTEFGVSRSTVKRNVMTFAYSAKQYGFGQQILEDHVIPSWKKAQEWAKESQSLLSSGLGLRQVEIQLGPKPICPWVDVRQGAKDATYLAGHVWRAVEQSVVKAAEGMDWLQRLTGLGADLNVPLNWVTPVGFPVQQAYWSENMIKIDTVISGSKRIRATVSTTDKTKINKRRQGNAIAPNFIHSLDAAHLLLTVVRSKQRGINNFLMVHDSFGCLPSDAGGDYGFFLTIRDALVEMYTHTDPLEDFKKHVMDQLPEERHCDVPEIPSKGELDIEKIILTRYSFS